MPPKDHAAWQKGVCAICFRKQKTLRNIAERVKIQIKEIILPGFGDNEWDWLPTVICGGCYKDLQDFQKNNR